MSEHGQKDPGDVKDGDLILENPDAVLRSLQARFASAAPRDVSLADELLAERREAARRESDKE